MKRWLAVVSLCLCGFAAHAQSTQKYMDGIEKLTIRHDTLAAKKQFHKILKRNPEHAPSWFQLSLLEADMGMARRAYELDTLNKWYAELYGTMLLTREDYAAALPVWERLVRLEPNDPENRRMASLLWGIHGDKNRDFAAYDRALELFADNTYVLNNYAYFLVSSSRVISDVRKALDFATRAVALTPHNPTILDTYGWVLYACGRLDEARAALQQALSYDGSRNPEILYHYSVVLRALGETFLADTYLQRAREAGYK